MPIYEYRCEACGHGLEKIQRISDEPLKDCPDCGEPRLQRLVSAAGFRLKGGGWYETDFKRDGKKNLHESGAKTSDAAKTESAAPTTEKKGTDSKPVDSKTSAA